MISTEVKLNIPAIAELVEPLEVLISKLDNKLKARVYGAIISEGASACIPGYILQKTVNRVYYNQEFDKVPLIHLGRHRCPDDFARTREHLRSNPECVNLSGLNEKALLITEHMESGRRLEEAGLLLHECGIKFDVATLFATQESDWYKYTLKCFHNERAEMFVGYRYPRHILLRYDLAGRIPAPSISHNDILNVWVFGEINGEESCGIQGVSRLVPLVRSDIDNVLISISNNSVLREAAL